MGKPRRTKDGIPFRYVFVDESGHPFYDCDNIGPFTMSAIVVNDSADAFRIIESGVGDGKGRTYTGEYKHSHGSHGKNERIIDGIEENGMAMFVTSQPMYNPTDYPEELAPVVYKGVLSRLLVKVAELGPYGIYRIRVDDNNYINESELLEISKAAFSSNDGRVLAKYTPARLFDSEFCAPVQLADSIVGEYRRSLIKGDLEDFLSKRKIVQVNKKPGKIWVRPTPRNSTQDNRIRVTESRDGVPHPSESRVLGNPRPVKKHWWSRI